MLGLNAIYVLWLRELKRYVRSKARIIGSMLMPVFFLIGFGLGLSSFVNLSGSGTYLQFIVPGMIGMTLLFTGATSGFQVIWDRQFGFLKEIMVTPNSRLSVALGRIAGGATTMYIPCFILITIAMAIGFHPVLSAASVLLLLYIALIGVTFISIGLIFASYIDDPQAFGVITNFVTFPLFFLSGALFPLSGLPKVVQTIAYFNPMTYGVDGIRYALLGTSTFHPAVDICALLVSSVVMLTFSALAFDKAKVD